MSGKEYSAWAISLCLAIFAAAMVFNLVTFLISLI
jgi:hypothetical protein